MKTLYITVIVSGLRTRIPCNDAVHAAEVRTALQRKLGMQVFISQPATADQFIQDEPEVRRAEVMAGWSRNPEA